MSQYRLTCSLCTLYLLISIIIVWWVIAVTYLPICEVFFSLTWPPVAPDTNASAHQYCTAANFTWNHLHIWNKMHLLFIKPSLHIKFLHNFLYVWHITFFYACNCISLKSSLNGYLISRKMNLYMIQNSFWAISMNEFTWDSRSSFHNCVINTSEKFTFSISVSHHLEIQIQFQQCLITTLL